MPRGRYSLHDPHDHTPLGEEHFHCATGPSGWRYVSQITAPAGDHAGSVDLTLDELGRPIRLELHAASWQVRGAALDGVTWVRTDPAGARPEGQRARPRLHRHLARLPRRHRTAAAPGARRRRDPRPPGRLHRAGPRAPHPRPVLGPDRTAHATDTGPLVVDEYRVTDLDTGEQFAVHLAGDVVLAAPGVELEELDAPPTLPG